MNPTNNNKNVTHEKYQSKETTFLFLNNTTSSIRYLGQGKYDEYPMFVQRLEMGWK